MTLPDAALVVSRVIRASPQRIFEAWTTPEQLLQWWGPQGVTCEHAQLDLRVGGRFSLGNRLPDGGLVVIEGEFLLIERPGKLVYTWSTSPDAPRHERVTVAFEPHALGTEVTVLHERIPDRPTRDAHEHGWLGCLDGLEAMLGDHMS